MPEQNPLVDDPGGIDFADPRWIPVLQNLGLIVGPPGLQGMQTQEQPWLDEFLNPASRFGFAPGGGSGGGGGAPAAAQSGAAQSPYGPYAGGYQFPPAAAGGASQGGGFLSGLGTGDYLDIAGALLGAASGYQNAQEAGRDRTTTTNQTTTQTPYGPSVEHLNRILNEQLALYQAGVPGGGGGGRQPGLSEYGQDAGDIFRRAAEQGLGAGSSPNMMLAGQSLQGILGGGGATGFEGYNPILADLAGRLGNVGLDLPTNLLMDFLGPGATGGGPGGGGGGGGGGGSFRSGPAGVGGGGIVPDTGAGSGTFQRELDRIFSEEANEEEIAAVLDSLSGDMERALYAGIRDIEARGAGAGRLGGSSTDAESQSARARYLEEMGQISAQLRYGDLEARRQARIAALNILNSRDLAAMSDLTQRAGINSSAASAAAANATARELGMRGQDLEAIMGIMQGQQFGLGTLAGLGQQLSGDRLGALSLIPGLEGVGLAGGQNAIASGGGLTGLEQINQQTRDRAAADARARAAGPQNLLNDYLRTVLSISQTGGQSTTQGTNVVPGVNISPTGAALQGGLGGYLGTRGLRTGG